VSLSLAITGTGAVTPAGWGAELLLETLRSGNQIATSLLERPLADGRVITPVKRVPNDPAGVPRSARLRRTSPISKFAAAAAIEALGPERLDASLSGNLRVGVILTLTNGCVNYSNRFFSEVLSNPAVASPILFPETVFNAPSSHLSAIIGSVSPNDTLIGDGTGFITGLDLAAEWIERGEVDGCLVVTAEEIDWLSSEALGLYSNTLIPAEGAAAVYLEAADGPVIIQQIPAPLPFHILDRETAAHLLRQRLGAADDGTTLLLDSTCGVARFDRPEISAWHGWTGPRWSPKRSLGDLLGAASGIQVAAAAMAIRHGLATSAVVSSIGSNQQAAGVSLNTGVSS
jgi:3-oxoacyl-(acyl-carrier-protein) synthase